MDREEQAADEDEELGLNIFDGAMSTTTTKSLEPADEDAEIGLHIFDSSALPACRPAVNEMSTGKIAAGRKNDLGNTQALATGASPHRRRPPKTKKSHKWAKPTGHGGHQREDFKRQGWNGRGPP